MRLSRPSPAASPSISLISLLTPVPEASEAGVLSRPGAAASFTPYLWRPVSHAAGAPSPPRSEPEPVSADAGSIRTALPACGAGAWEPAAQPGAGLGVWLLRSGSHASLVFGLTRFLIKEVHQVWAGPGQETVPFSGRAAQCQAPAPVCSGLRGGHPLPLALWTQGQTGNQEKIGLGQP